MATLNLRIDPRQMETGADRAENALQGVKREARQTESAVDKMSGSIRGAGHGLRGASSRLSATTSAFRSMRGQIQNTAFQVGDFATQVGAGTSASVALGQQLPQLLGGFGALGAVMGAVVAIGVPLAANLLDIGGNSEDLTESLDGLYDAIERYKAASDLANASTEELEERFGSAAGEIRSTLEVLDQIAASEAQRKIDGINESISNLLGIAGDGDRRSALAQFFDVNIFLAFTDAQREARAEARELTAEFVAQQDALRNSAGDLNAQIPIMEKLLASATALANANGSVNEEEEALIKNLAETLLSMQKQRAAVEDTADSMSQAGVITKGLQSAVEGVGGAMEAIAGGDISGPFDDALAAGIQLFNKAKEIAEIQSGPLSFGDNNLSGPSLVLDPKTGEYVTSGQTAITQQLGAGLPFVTVPDEPSSSAGSFGGFGGGGGASGAADEVDELADSYDRLIASMDPLERASQDLAAAQETINEALKAGVINAGEAAQAQALAQEKYTEATERAAESSVFLDDIAGDVKSSIVDAAMGGADAMDHLAESIKRAAIEYALFGDGDKFNGLLGGAMDSLFGGLFGGGSAKVNIPEWDIANSFDGGGYTGAGARSGGVDGKGGFPAILHPNETVVDHTKGQAFGGRIENNVEVNIIGAESQPEVRQHGGRIDIDFRKALKNEVRSGALRSELRQIYGLNPKPQGA